METEIKLLLDPRARGEVESHPLFAGAEARAEQERTTYFDTPDLALRGLGATLRIRASERGFVQTIKLKGASAVTRGEWEWPVDGITIDPRPIAAEPEIRQAFDALIDRVSPVFDTDVTRTRRQLVLDGKTGVEAVIDEGMVRAGARREAISEVELELKTGPAGPLFRLASDLSARAQLRFGADSKADRGYALLTDTPPPAPPARPPALTPGTSVAEGITRLLDAALAAFAAELPGAARGDVEGLHRLRSALRRLRSVFALGKPLLETDAVAAFDHDLRRLGGVLGQGRDWDVFLTETLAAAAGAVGEDAVVPLRLAAASRSAAAHRGVAEAIAGPEPTDIILRLGAWIAEPRRLADDPDRRLADAVPELLDRLAARVRKRHKHLREDEPEDLHRLRKAMKTLRYGTEDLAALGYRKAAVRYLRRIKTVLGSLGAINDAAVTVCRIAELGPEAGTPLGTAADAVLIWNAKRRRKALRAFATDWRKFADAEPFWA